MGIALDAYRAAVGLFSLVLPGILEKLMSKKCFLPKGFHASSSLQLFLVLKLVIFFSRLLTLAGDVELNPGPINNKCKIKPCLRLFQIRLFITLALVHLHLCIYLADFLMGPFGQLCYN